jgi:hypothetical protein
MLGGLGANRAAWWLLAALAAVLLTSCSSAITGRGSAPPSPAMSGSADFPSSDLASPSTATATATATSTPIPPPTPATGGPSTVVVTVSPIRPGTVDVPAGFVGTWYGHGRALTVGATGAITLEFRTYVDCTATVTTGCDRVEGNTISDGGHVTGQVSQVINRTTVWVTLTSTTAPSELPRGTYRLGRDLQHGAVALFAGQWSQAPFCGPDAPSGYCGA